MILWKIYQKACYKVADSLYNGLRKAFGHLE
jgi:hypothetical protein